MGTKVLIALTMLTAMTIPSIAVGASGTEEDPLDICYEKVCPITPMFEVAPRVAIEIPNLEKRIEETHENLTEPQPTAGGGGTSTEEPQPYLRCWDWHGEWPDDLCSRNVPQSKEFNYVVAGVYYCPPQGQSVNCDKNGAPTDGTVDLQFSGTNTYYTWCVHYDDGVKTAQCDFSGGGNRVFFMRAGSIFAGDNPHCCRGTFGGYVNRPQT